MKTFYFCNCMIFIYLFALYFIHFGRRYYHSLVCNVSLSMCADVVMGVIFGNGPILNNTLIYSNPKFYKNYTGGEKQLGPFLLFVCLFVY